MKPLKQWVTAWLKNRNVRILSGPGAGLKFNAAGTQLGYILGKSELPVQKALAGALRPGDTFYDVGANIGFFTMVGAKLVGSSGHVYAFEPVPDNIAKIQHNIQLNQFKHVSVVAKAVSNVSRPGQLHVTYDVGGATLASVGNPIDQKETITVQLTTIDDFVNSAESQHPPHVVKIDVEGAEMEVLKGMIGTIEHYRPIIIFEIDDSEKTTLEQKYDQCCVFLTQRGYEITRLTDSYPNRNWYVKHGLAIQKPDRTAYRN